MRFQDQYSILKKSIDLLTINTNTIQSSLKWERITRFEKKGHENFIQSVTVKIFLNLRKTIARHHYLSPIYHNTLHFHSKQGGQIGIIYNAVTWF